MRPPGFAAVIILTLALGIGANTAIFSVVHAILIRPMDYPDSEDLAFVSSVLRRDPKATFPVSYPDLMSFREDTRVFGRFGGAMDAQFVVTGVSEPARVKGAYVTAEMLDLLRVAPLRGRLLGTADDVPGAARVCVLAHRAWQRFFQGADDVVGRSLMLDGHPHVVVGVMPPSFKFWDAWAYVPLVHGVPAELRQVRDIRMGLWGVGRLAPGRTFAEAQEEFDVLARRLDERTPSEGRGVTARVQPLAATVGAQLRTTLLLLLGAVTCVLLIACVNVTNLLLARGAARQREYAVRATLGASRGRLIAQMLGEALPLGLAAAVCGALLAAGGLRLLMSFIPADLVPAEARVRLSLPVLAYTAVLSLASATLAAVLPALQGSRQAVAGFLKEGSRGTWGVHGTRVRGVLIVSEVALALILLTGAGIVLRNLASAARMDLGFARENLLLAQIDLPETRYPEPERGLAFSRELEERMARFPDVLSVGAVTTVPLFGGTFSLPLLLEGQAYPTMKDLKSSLYNSTSPSGMQALGLRLVRGRLFQAEDRAGGERVAILNEAAVRQFFPHEDPLGRFVASGIPRALAGENPAGLMAAFSNPQWARVVGVVEDTRQYAVSGDPQPEVYYPRDQSLPVPPVRNSFTLAIRTASDPVQVAGVLRGELRSMDPDVPLDRIRTMEAVVDESLKGRRFLVVLLGLFAGVALVLATVGIYSVLAWLVGQRTREMGIRLALGAPPRGVVGLVIRQGAAPVVAGLALGVVLVVALGRILDARGIGDFRTDGLTPLLVVLLLAGAALAACWLPARRAARVDPMLALRTE